VGTTTGDGTGAAGSGGVTSGGGDPSTSDTGSSSGGGGVGGAAGAGDDGGCPGTTSGGDCSGRVEAVNLYLMLDAGTSMVDHEVDGVLRWDLVTTGINEFLASPELTGHAVNVGIQFFAWVDDSSCDVSNYSTASVDIGPVADVSTAIASELEDHEVGGLTPSFPALSGAITYAKSWAATAPNEHTAVVFLTDGYPTECEPQDLSALVELAAASFGNAPSVPVHLFGIDGAWNLDEIADAGGTSEAAVIVSAEDLTADLTSIATTPFGD